jgi:uncharacterized protein YifE (UPF0438 family)
MEKILNQYAKDLEKAWTKYILGIIESKKRFSNFTVWQKKGDYKKGYLDALENLKLEILANFKK